MSLRKEEKKLVRKLENLKTCTILTGISLVVIVSFTYKYLPDWWVKALPITLVAMHLVYIIVSNYWDTTRARYEVRRWLTKNGSKLLAEQMIFTGSKTAIGMISIYLGDYGYRCRDFEYAGEDAIKFRLEKS